MNKQELQNLIENSDEIEETADELEAMPEQQKEHNDASSKYEV